MKIKSTQETYIGEIGFNCDDISPTGIAFERIGTVPNKRVIIVEPAVRPDGKKDPYAECNNPFAVQMTKIGITTVEGDIYHPSTFDEKALPQMGVLVAENVLNDPWYPESKKDWKGLLALLKKALCPKGLFVIIDTILTWDNKDMYSALCSEVQEDREFKVILDETNSNHQPEEFRGSLELIKNIGQQPFVDSALIEGLNDRESHSRWLVIRRE